MLITSTRLLGRAPQHAFTTPASTKAATSIGGRLAHPSPFPSSVGKDQTVPHVAPPSAVQMQIKALISEQSLSQATNEASKTVR